MSADSDERTSLELTLDRKVENTDNGAIACEETQAPTKSNRSSCDVGGAARTFPFRERLPLYVSHFLSAWSDRLWEFSVPVLLVDIFGNSTLLHTVLFAAVSYFASSISSPYLGRLVDSRPRRRLVSTLLVVQNVSIVISAVGLLMIERNAPGPSFASWNSVVWIMYFLSLSTCALAACMSSALTVALEKDWVPTLAPDDDTLLDLNCTMRRIDLVCKFGTPAIMGVIIEYLPLQAVVQGMACWNAVSLVPEYALLMHIYDSNVAILARHEAIPESEGGESGGTADDQNERVVKSRGAMSKLRRAVDSAMDSWREYSQCNAFGISLSIVTLYFTVLAPSGVLSAYLRSQDISVAVVGYTRAAAAVLGLLSTYIVPTLIRRVGLVRTATASSVVFFLCVLPCAVSFISFKALLPLFLSALALSRIPLWCFDITQAQIMQVYVLPRRRGTVGGVQRSLSDVASAAILLVSVGLHSPSQFVYLTGLSIASVFVGAVLALGWYARTGRHLTGKFDQRRRDSIDASTKSDDAIELNVVAGGDPAIDSGETGFVVEVVDGSDEGSLPQKVG